MVIKENKPIYADRAEEICNYVKDKISDDGWIDIGEIYVADMLNDDEPLIIIPTYITVKDLAPYDDKYDDYADQVEFILFANIDTDDYTLICKPYEYNWDFDIARRTDLDTAINKLNKFLSDPVANFKLYDLQVVE